MASLVVEMPRCKVCRLPAGEQSFVNARLLAGASPRSIAKRLRGITRPDVAKHHKLCPNSKAEKEDDAQEEHRADA